MVTTQLFPESVFEEVTPISTHFFARNHKQTGGAAVAHNKIISQRPIRGIKNISGLSRNHLSVIIGAQRADGSSCQKSPIGVHLGKVAIFIFDVLHPPQGDRMQ